MEDLLVSIFAGLLVFAPLIMQQIVYSITKLCLKKIHPAIIYVIGLVVNTILLYCIKEWLFYSSDKSEMAGFGYLFLMIMWTLLYLGLLISCIFRIVKAVENRPK